MNESIKFSPKLWWPAFFGGSLLLVLLFGSSSGVTTTQAQEPTAEPFRIYLPVILKAEEGSATATPTVVQTGEATATPTVAPTSQPGLLIQNIEVNQVLGIQKNNGKKFVAGKDTVIRAFLKEKSTIDANKTSLVVKRNGTMVTTLSPKTVDGTTDVVDFLCPSATACGNWAAGTYSFEAKVNDDPMNVEGYEFKERATVRILAIPVKACFKELEEAPIIKSVQGEDWKKFDFYTRDVYPVAGEKLKWAVREEVDASDCEKYDLNTDNGQLGVWQALTALMPAECQANPKADGCYELIVGFIAQAPKTKKPDGSIGTLAGFTYGKPTNIVVATDQDAPATVAHEVAHTYGIGDTYDTGTIRCSVNQGYTGITGRLWDEQETAKGGLSLCKETKHPKYDTILIPATAYHPYEVGKRGALTDMGDYMGSSAKQEEMWTSAEVYDWLFDQLAIPAPTVSSMADERLVYYFGTINPTTKIVKLEPWETYTDTIESTVSAKGTYWIAGLDASGQQVVSQTLEVEVDPPASKGEKTQELLEVPFEGTMRFPVNVVQFKIMSQTEVLTTVKVSANDPIVTNVVPTLAGNITWTANDPDGDKLTYYVEYNFDVTKPASEWMILKDGLTENKADVDFSALPGSAHAQIRVVASDGIRSGEAASAPFNVPAKAPKVWLDELAWGNTYDFGDEVELSAEGYDMQNELLEIPLTLEWRSNLTTTVLGTDDLIVVDNLPKGNHVITLQATNTAGLTATDTITLTVK